MNIKTFLTTLLLTVVCFTGVYAQQTTTKYYFFDNNWKLTTSKNYTFYRKVEVYANGNYANPIVDYYRNGQVQCIVKADTYNLNHGGTFLTAGGKNGETVFYDVNGNMLSYQRYANGQVIEDIVIGQKKSATEEWTLDDAKDVLEIGVMAYQVYKFFKGGR